MAKTVVTPLPLSPRRQRRGQVAAGGGVAWCCSICCPYSVIEKTPQCLCYCEVTVGCRNPCGCEAGCQCPCCAVSALDCPEQRELRASAKESRRAYFKTTLISSSLSGVATDGRRLSVTQEQWDLLLPKVP